MSRRTILKLNKKTFSNIAFIIGHLWKCSPMRVILVFLTTLGSSLVEITISVYLLRFVINGIQDGLSFLQLLLVLTLVMGSVLAFMFFMDWFNNVFIPRSDLKIHKYFDNILFKKILEIDLEYFDKSEFYDQYTRAIQEAPRRALAVLNDLTNLISSGMVLTSLAAVLFAMDPVLIAFSLTPIVFSLPLSIIRNKLNFRYQQDITLDNRKLDYCKRVLYEKRYAKEIKITNIANVILKKYVDSNQNLSNLAKKYGLKRTGIGFWETFNQIAIVMYATYVYLIYRITITRTLLIGDFISLYNAVRNAEYSLRRIIEVFPRMHEHAMFIQNIRDFLNLEPTIKNPEKPLNIGTNNTIEIKNVHFSYNNESRKVLQDICIRIDNNQKIAIVGRNGAGKTTLIKTILRLYQPESGTIFYGDNAYDEYALEDYHALFGTVFQDFALYHISVAENVMMDFVSPDDEVKIVNILKKVGLYDKVQATKKGIYTDISKEFSEDGIVFSGGEQQKIAIARAFIHPSKILIFDEASSALDPISEYEINNMILEMAENKSVILISHRLSTTRNADIIYYMEDGQIKEFGTHSELMELGGGYAKMFTIQAEQYVGTIHALG